MGVFVWRNLINFQHSSAHEKEVVPHTSAPPPPAQATLGQAAVIGGHIYVSQIPDTTRSCPVPVRRETLETLTANGLSGKSSDSPPSPPLAGGGSIGGLMRRPCACVSPKIERIQISRPATTLLNYKSYNSVSLEWPPVVFLGLFDSRLLVIVGGGGAAAAKYIRIARVYLSGRTGTNA